MRNQNRIRNNTHKLCAIFKIDRKIESKDFVDLSIPVPKVLRFGNNSTANLL